jgi:hypothetical protein
MSPEQLRKIREEQARQQEEKMVLFATLTIDHDVILFVSLVISKPSSGNWRKKEDGMN